MVIFDIETRGLEFDGQEILELAALRIRDGQIQESYYYIKEDLSHASLQTNHRHRIMDFFNDTVLISHEVSASQSILEREFKLRIQQPVWDTLVLARIFFPTMHHYQLSYLAEKLCFPQIEKKLNSERKAWLIWLVFQACWKKGLEFDLSFFNQANDLLEGWVREGFFQDLQKEVIRSFPDRRIYTDLVLSPSTEGLFSYTKTPSAIIPPSIDWVVDNFSQGGNLERNLENYESRPGQVTMARLIAEGLSSSHHVVVEAGTGTGYPQSDYSITGD